MFQKGFDKNGVAQNKLESFMFYSNEHLIGLLRDYYVLTEDIPPWQGDNDSFPARSTYRRRFGSWRHALALAGIKSKKSPAGENVIKTCAGCGKTVVRSSSQSLRSKGGSSFCSHSCSASYHNVLSVKPIIKTQTECRNCFCEFEHSAATERIFCTGSCQGAHKWRTKTLPAIRDGTINRRPTLRKYLIDRDGYGCTRCGATEWLDEPIPLCVDHIDGDATHNKPENLRLLCQNCHGLTPTFAGRNKGNGRKSRGIRRYDEYDLAPMTGLEPA